MSIFRIFLPLLTFWSILQLEAVSLSPAPKQNFCPIVLVNNTGLPSNQVYFVIYGLNGNNLPCFLVPNLTTGECAYNFVTPNGLPSSASCSVTLDQLPTAINTGLSGQAYLIYLPMDISSRAYFSLNSPVYLLTSFDSAIGLINIAAVSPGSYTDPNFYTLNSFVEFVFEPVSNLTSATQLFLDLSYVDYFSLPMQIAAYNYPQNTVIQAPVLPSTDILSTPSGMTASASINRETIIATTLAGLTGVWQNLGVPFYANQYTDTTPSTYLKVLSAKNSITLSTGTGFQMPATPIVYFPSNYVYTASIPASPSPLSLMQFAWQWLGTTTFYAQIYPQSLPATVYAISAVTSGGLSGPLTIQFVDKTNATPQNVQLDLATLGTENLLSGGVWPFTPGSVPAAYTNELSKLVSALFGIGEFPPTGIPSSLASPFSNSTVPHADAPYAFTNYAYFSNPTGTGKTGPWYNLFDEVMHPQMVSGGALPSPNNLVGGQGYAYDYDDLLGMSGTISGMQVQDALGNPSETTSFNGTDYPTCSPYYVVSLENVGSLANIPNIANDAYNYAVTVGASTGAVSVVYNWYNQAGVLNHTTTPTMGTTLLNMAGDGLVHVNSSQPFTVTFTFSYGPGPTTITRTYNINLQRQIATPVFTGLPSTTTYDAIDAQFLTGITFIVGGTATAPTFTVDVDSTVPPWPG